MKKTQAVTCTHCTTTEQGSAGKHGFSAPDQTDIMRCGTHRFRGCLQGFQSLIWRLSKSARRWLEAPVMCTSWCLQATFRVTRGYPALNPVWVAPGILSGTLITFVTLYSREEYHHATVLVSPTDTTCEAWSQMTGDMRLPCHA